jgi:hypothetical protein
VKYLLTFHVEEGAMDDASPEEMKAGIDAWSAFDSEAAAKGALIACEPLEASSKTTTIRLGAGGDRLVTDGPFAETKEQLGGFCLLECSGPDEALEWAHKVPMRSGAIEVRPIMDLSEFGYESRTLRPSAAAA